MSYSLKNANDEYMEQEDWRFTDNTKKSGENFPSATYSTDEISWK
jgi:hypothetical protein